MLACIVVKLLVDTVAALRVEIIVLVMVTDRTAVVPVRVTVVGRTDVKVAERVQDEMLAV
jgi:hypothetical protein